MRKYLVWTVLVGLVVVWTVCAQEKPKAGSGDSQAKPNEKQKLELAHKQLELKAHSDEVAFQQETRELQLEKQRLELQKQRAALKSKPELPPHPGMRPPSDRCGGHGCPMARHCMRGVAALMLLCLVIHILLTIWVYQDIRKRNAGSGIWIVITLLAGVFGAALYALVRIGDKPPAT